MPSRMVVSPTKIRVGQKLLKIPLSALVKALHVYTPFEKSNSQLNHQPKSRRQHLTKDYSSHHSFCLSQEKVKSRNMKKIFTILRVSNDINNFLSVFWIQIDVLYPKRQIKSSMGIPKHQSPFNFFTSLINIH